MQYVIAHVLTGYRQQDTRAGKDQHAGKMAGNGDLEFGELENGESGPYRAQSSAASFLTAFDWFIIIMVLAVLSGGMQDDLSLNPTFLL